MRRILKISAILVLAIAVYIGWEGEQPVPMSPSPDWEASITSPDFAATTFSVPVVGAELEAMILIPQILTGHLARSFLQAAQAMVCFKTMCPDF
jgi:hypothetical protein